MILAISPNTSFKGRKVMKATIRVRTLLLGTVAIFVIGMTSILGQESRGTITGRIADPNGAVVPNATVSIKNVETNIESTITTNDEGIYVAPLLNPGKYAVSVAASGFKKSLRDQI